MLTILAILIILLLIYFFKTILFKKPKYLDYTKDKIEVLTYRWAYTGKEKNYAIRAIWAFCPKCDCELVNTSMKVANRTDLPPWLKCPNCKFSCGNPFTDGDIKRIIHKRIRDKYNLE